MANTHSSLAVTPVDQLSEAASNGSIPAMISLAEIYNDRDSALFSLKQAQSWYEQAASKGNARAQRALGAMYELGRGIKKNDDLAAFWYQKAASQGLARAQTNLGNLYETGRGVPMDNKEAYRWYKDAARQGYARAQVYLGRLYNKGMGVDKSPSKAIFWYKKAAIQGYTRGQFWLGKVYEKGMGVNTNLQEARLWYDKAAAQGFPPARTALKRLTKAESRQKPGHKDNSAEPIMVPKEAVFTINALAENEIRHQDTPNSEKNIDGKAFLASVMDKECSDFSPGYMDREVLSAEADLEDHDPGVKFESGYRFRGGDTTSERQKAYAGLSWDLFNEGLLENRSQARRREMEKEVKEIRAAQERHKELFPCRDTFLIHYFNRFKKNILVERQKVLGQLYQLSRQSYFSGAILADDLLKIELQVARTKTRLAAYERLQGQIVSSSQLVDQRPPPTIVGLNLDAITQAIRDDPSYNKLSKLSKAILKERYNPLYEKRLRFFAQTGINEDQGHVSSGDVAAGVYFSTPLMRQTKEPLPYKIKRMQTQLEQAREIRLRDAARLYNAYNEKLTDATTMYYRIQTLTERLRRSLLKSKARFQETGTYGFAEHMLVLNHLQDLLGARLEYVAVQESLYRQLLHVFTTLRTGYRDGFITPIPLKLPTNRGRLGNRSVYVWSKSFNENDNNYIFNLLRAKGISNVILSAGRTSQAKKLSTFLDRSTIEHVSVELMVSENSWIFPEKWPEISERIEKIAQYGRTIHLDIEPHTLPNYREKRQEYDALFLKFMARTANICDKHHIDLSISLPLSASVDLITAADKLAKHIYVMAYGSFDIKRLIEKLQPFSNISKKKLVIGQRPADFSSQRTLENRLDTLATEFSIDNFAFHDLEQLMNLMGRNTL